MATRLAYEHLGIEFHASQQPSLFEEGGNDRMGI